MNMLEVAASLIPIYKLGISYANNRYRDNTQSTPNIS